MQPPSVSSLTTSGHHSKFWRCPVGWDLQARGGGGKLPPESDDNFIFFEKGYKWRKDWRERSKRKHSVFDFFPSLLLPADHLFSISCLDSNDWSLPHFSSVTNKRDKLWIKSFCTIASVQLALLTSDIWWTFFTPASSWRIDVKPKV